MAIAVAIEVLVVLALLLHNSEMWFGRYISINEQSAFVGLVTVTVFAYLLRMRFRILKEARVSFLAAMKEARDSFLTANARLLTQHSPKWRASSLRLRPP